MKPQRDNSTCAVKSRDAAITSADSKQEYLLWTMFAHELKKQQRLVHVTPVFLCVLQASGNHSHYLFVVVYVVRSFCNFCVEPVLKLNEALYVPSACCCLTNASLLLLDRGMYVSAHVMLTSHCRAMRAPRIVVCCLLNLDFDIGQVESILFSFVPPCLHIPQSSIRGGLHLAKSVLQCLLQPMYVYYSGLIMR